MQYTCLQGGNSFVVAQVLYPQPWGVKILRMRPTTDFKGIHQLAIPAYITARAPVMHVPWCMSGSLILGGGENAFPGHAQLTILRIW